ncbi:hypothetical protein E2C01_095084 [Portunus trituberculatus]|uniref:Uncharacterized protein n=1 Tax=Portunus trituberculatus TaxID=210409 RepID=A0A5B7K2U4_PORTR|nr:hypothetical protein [Portunus trituberculatus]
MLSHDIVEAVRQSSAAFDCREESHDKQSHFIGITMTHRRPIGHEYGGAASDTMSEYPPSDAHEGGSPSFCVSFLH